MNRKRYRICFALFLLVGLCCACASAQSPANPSLPSSISDLRPVLQDDRILKAPPQVEVQPDGTAVLTFETLVPSPRVHAYFGQLNPDAFVETPYFRYDSLEAIQSPATAHRVVFGLRRLFASELMPPTDVYYRLEIYDSRISGSKFYQSRFTVAAVSGRFEKRTTILTGPFVDQMTDHSAVIFWTTDRPSRGVVELFAHKDSSQAKGFLGNPDLETDHRIKITGLNAGVSYAYHVLVFDEHAEKPANTSPTYSFHAAPGKNGKFKFGFLSDGRPSPGGGLSNLNGVNAEVTQELLIDGYRRGADFIIFSGDLTAGYTSSIENFNMMLDTWKAVSEPVGHFVPIYEGFGNHESLQDFFTDANGLRYHRARTDSTSAEAVFARHFANPEDRFPEAEHQNGVKGPDYRGTVYSFDYGNSHFIELNMDYWFNGGGPLGDPATAWKVLGGNREGYIMKNQMNWLAQDLAAARKRGVVHIFICGHDMAFPTGGHTADAMYWNGLNNPSIPSGDVRDMRDRFLKLVNEYRVTAMFFGHEHNYSRTLVDSNLSPLITHPFTQIVSGGAGAPFYPQDLNVPWISNVKKYAMVHHYVLVSVDGAKVSVSAVDEDGHVFDQAVLTEGK
ncbi:MAG: metallophosphoesterase [Acidobacteriia bacterium]|nr:metallophosphoesterase [Terriglobia bacterium]